jgi:hypothetical protein
MTSQLTSFLKIVFLISQVFLCAREYHQTKANLLNIHEQNGDDLKMESWWESESSCPSLLSQSSAINKESFKSV